MMSPDVAAELRALPSPFTELFGLRIDTLMPEEVTASLTVDPARHLHPWGAVHGGVYCTLIETLATLGAQLSALPAGKLASGIENHTSFLRQVRDGELKARAVAINRGRQLHLWAVTITDERDRLVAHGVVRLALLHATPRQEPGSPTGPREAEPS
jgi:1,4-dihydroxy-2-naphthoyl-CoA hydrolase